MTKWNGLTAEVKEALHPYLPLLDLNEDNEGCRLARVKYGFRGPDGMWFGPSQRRCVSTNPYRYAEVFRFPNLPTAWDSIANAVKSRNKALAMFARLKSRSPDKPAASTFQLEDEAWLNQLELMAIVQIAVPIPFPDKENQS